MGTPLGPPPAGGNQDRGPSLLATLWTEWAVAFMVVALRSWARLMLKKLGIDDWIMFFTLFLFLVSCILTSILVSNGGARHLYYLTPQQISTVVKFNWMSQPFGVTGVGAGKISTAFLLLRLMGPNTVWRKWFIYAMIAITTVITIVQDIITFGQCNPPRALWEPVPGSSCWDPRVDTNFGIFGASWNCLTDTALALLPITIVWNLKMKLGRKVALCSTLGLGIFASMSSAIKASKLNGLNARSDLIWATHELYVWSSAEIFIIIVLGSVPTLKPLYERFIKPAMSSFFSQSRPSKQPYQRSDPVSRERRLGSFAHSQRAGHEAEDLWVDTEADDEIRLRNIRVSQTFGVQENEEGRAPWTQSRKDGGKTEVRGRDLV